MLMPLFKTPEFAAVLGVRPMAVRDLVKEGFLVPALPGGSPGHVHRFSGQQLIAMATAKVLGTTSRGCPWAHGRLILAYYEAMSDGALLVRLGLSNDPRDVAEFEAWNGGPEKRALFDPDRGMPWEVEELARVADDLEAALDRAHEAIRARMKTAPRTAERQVVASAKAKAKAK